MHSGRGQPDTMLNANKWSKLAKITPRRSPLHPLILFSKRSDVSGPGKSSRFGPLELGQDPIEGGDVSLGLGKEGRGSRREVSVGLGQPKHARYPNLHLGQAGIRPGSNRSEPAGPNKGLGRKIKALGKKCNPLVTPEMLLASRGDHGTFIFSVGDPGEEIVAPIQESSRDIDAPGVVGPSVQEPKMVVEPQDTSHKDAVGWFR